MKFIIEDGVLEDVEAMDSETAMIIPEGVTSVESIDSLGNNQLISITLPDSINDVGGLKFIRNQDNWDKIIVSKSNRWFTSIEGVLYNKSVTELIRCPAGKTSVYVPDSVTSIDSNAFFYCKILTYVKIPNSVSRIGMFAFQNCEKLTSIAIPFNIETIEFRTFYNCIELNSIVIPDRVTTIDGDAFEGCKNLTHITIGDSVENIYCPFSGCDRLSSILVSNKNNSFKVLDGVLYGSNRNELVRCLPNKSEYIIPDSVTTIGDNAFDGCEKLTSIIIPDTVKHIGAEAFNSCRNLKSVFLLSSVESIEECTFNDCTSLTSIVIPESVTSIGSGAFHGCTSLISIFIPDGITIIDDNTFEDCTNLTSIVIPKSVTRIGDYVFSCCTNLISVFMSDSITSIGVNAFDQFKGCPNLTIYAPANSYAESYAKENEINFIAKSNNMFTGAKQGCETKLTNNVAKKSRSKLDLITSSEDQLYNDFYDSFDDSDEPFGGCIFLISVKSEDIASIIVERYADQCGESGLSKYDLVTSDDGIPVHLFRESGICMFEISSEGEYGGPLPERLETLTDIVKYWVKNFFRNDESRNFEGYELDQYIESAEYLEMMSNLKCKGTYYQGRFKYSEDISDCFDPSHMHGFAFAESYIDDYISD